MKERVIIENQPVVQEDDGRVHGITYELIRG